MNETTIVYNNQKSGYLAKCWSLTQAQAQAQYFIIKRIIVKVEKPTQVNSGKITFPENPLNLKRKTKSEADEKEAAVQALN